MLGFEFFQIHNVFLLGFGFKFMFHGIVNCTIFIFIFFDLKGVCRVNLIGYLVNKTIFQGFAGIHPGFFIHHLLNGIKGNAGFLMIDVCNNLF